MGKNRVRFFLAFTLAFLILPLRLSRAHPHLADSLNYSHVDAYADSTAVGIDELFDLQCITAAAASDATGANGWQLVEQGNLPHIDFNRFSNTWRSPKTSVLLLVANKQWTGLLTAAISNMEVKIKRTVLKPGTPPSLTKEEVRGFAFPNLNVGLPDDKQNNVCLSWDGSIVVDDKGYGKVNGSYEVEVAVHYATSDTKVDATMFYPGAGFIDTDNVVRVPYPIIIDVMDIHSVTSSPTVVGSLPALPINMGYKLSKSGLVTIDIFRGSSEKGGIGCQPDLNENVGNNTTNF